MLCVEPAESDHHKQATTHWSPHSDPARAGARVARRLTKPRSLYISNVKCLHALETYINMSSNTGQTSVRLLSHVIKKTASVPGRLPSAPPIGPYSVAFRPWMQGGSRSPSAGGLRFFGFRVKVWCGGAQMAVVSSSPVKSLRLQPHLCNDIEKFVEVVWFSRTFGWGDLRLCMELHRRLLLLL
jgi:hypothetical protein